MIRKRPSRRRRYNNKNDKLRSMFTHAKLRAWQRYGVVLTKELHEKIVNEILCGRSDLLKRQTVSRSIYIVEVEEARYKVVYDKTRKALKTFLSI